MVHFILTGHSTSVLSGFVTNTKVLSRYTGALAEKKVFNECKEQLK